MTLFCFNFLILLKFTVMDISTTKLSLIDLLLKTQKESILEKIKSIFEEELKYETPIINSFVYDPISEYEYNKKLKKSEKDFKEGKVKSHDEIKKKYSL